ncbi:MAG: hypothetical protein LBQ87_06450 [Candidatus Fibromonas sp.]|nr:hypothetical protein [Candidatus Fibromonas sp.]
MTKKFQRQLILTLLMTLAAYALLFGIIIVEQPGNKFLYGAIAIFLINFVLIVSIRRYVRESISRLKDLSDMQDRDLQKIKENERRLAMEKEKLFMHLQASAEGICFFNANRTVAFYNGLFLQHFNLISHNFVATGKEILTDECFNAAIAFLNHSVNEDYFETRIISQGRNFLLRMNVFEDRSFEIILVDVTAREKSRRLKQEMTGNIAHELRTPVTSIRGFLEILLGNNLSEEKKHEYTQRAFLQTQVLSELISDMSLLTKIDGKAEALQLENVNISQLISKVYADLSSALEEKCIKFSSDVPPDIVISGNPGLLYSIFRNLTDNVLRHAGSNVEISIKINEFKDGRAYFIFADNGKGIEDEKHLSRLFERFYRVDEGRARDTGGSGLGLSIVKNAVFFHGGKIRVRKGKDRGLEFLFSLALAR